MVDPRAKQMSINRKYWAKGSEKVYFNLLVFSNHADAFVLPEGERRLAAFSNTDKVRSGGYYTELFDMLGAELYAGVYAGLMARDVSAFNHAMPPVTEAKDLMVLESRGPCARALDMVLEGGQELWTRGQLVDAVKDALRVLDLGDVPPMVREREVGRAWRRMGNLRPGNKNGLRTRYGAGNNTVEVRASARGAYWRSWAADDGRSGS